MNTPAFFRGAFRAVFVLLVAGLLAACAPIMEPPDAGGNLRILLSGGAVNRAISAEIEAALSYTLDFSGPGGESLSRTTEPGTPSLTLSLGLGAWTIKAQAFLSGELFGTGETAVTVEAGKTNEAMITMHIVTSDSPALTSAKDITAFTFADPPATGSISGTDIAVTVPDGTNVTGLTPTITYTGASISPASGVVQDFSVPVTYIVTAADSSTQTYTVTVTVEVVLGSIAAIGSWIDNAVSDDSSAGNSDGNPIALPRLSLNLADTGGNGWLDLLSALQSKGKYVNLDLSACTMGGTEFDPGTADTGEQYITALTLPTAATGITPGSSSSDYTFRHFTSLKSVTGPNILSIDPHTFCAGSSSTPNTILTTVNLPAVEDIGDEAFYYCTALASVSFPEVETIGMSAFWNTDLSSVTFPASLTEIKTWAFRDTLLSSVHIPAALTTISGSVFNGCTNLTTITVAPENSYCKNSADNKMLLTKDGTTLLAYPSAAGTVTLDPSITRTNNAFASCTGLISVTAPGVTDIGQNTFHNCTSLTSVNIPGATSIGMLAFYKCSALTSVSFPSAVTIDTSAFSNCTSLASVDLSAATSIGSSAFAYTGNTTLTVTLGNAVPALGERMFYDVSVTKNVIVKVPSDATGWDSIIGSYTGSDTSNNWGNGFRGGGWESNGFFYGMGDSDNVNDNINLTVMAIP